MKERGRPEFHPETVVECPGVHVLEKVWEEAGHKDVDLHLNIHIYLDLSIFF